MKYLKFIPLLFLLSCEEERCRCEMRFVPLSKEPIVFYGESCEEFNGKQGIYYENGTAYPYVFFCKEE